MVALAVFALGITLACAGGAPGGTTPVEPAAAPTATAAPLAVAPALTAVPDTPTPEPTTTPPPSTTPTVAATSPAPVAESLIQLEDPLDEPEFYCVDVVGFRNTLKLDRALQAHTCKPGYDDEMFSFNRPSPGQLYMAAYDLCVEAGDGRLYLKPCSQSPPQRFSHEEDGSLRPEGSDLCLAVESGSGQQAGGPSHVRRDLLLAPCADTESGRMRWLFPGVRP